MTSRNSSWSNQEMLGAQSNQSLTGQANGAIAEMESPRVRLMRECQEHAKVLQKRIAEYEAGRNAYEGYKAELEAVMAAVSALAGNGVTRAP